MAERQSMSLDGDMCRIVKVYSNTSNGDRAQYKTMRVSYLDTFCDLKLRVLDKYGILRCDEMFYFLSVQYMSDITGQWREVVPYPQELVMDCMRVHDIYCIGDTCLYLKKITNDSRHLASSTQYDAALTSMHVEEDQMTEYINTAHSTDLPVTHEVLREIESIALKTGFLSKHHRASDTWRSVCVYLTDDRLYYAHEPDWIPYHYLPLDQGVTTTLTEDVLTIHAVPRSVSFRGQNRTVLQQWAEAVIRPQDLASDNAIFYDLERISQQESFDAAVSDVEYTLDCVKFKNMINNRFLRKLFREYLTASHADETYKFFEYAEDFYRSHPNSLDPFLSSELNEVDDMGNCVWLQAWAVELFRVFIQDQGSQQIGCCSSVDKSDIENLLHCPGFDIFRKVQMNTLAYVENTMHSQFLLKAGLRSALQNASNYKRCSGRNHRQDNITAGSNGQLFADEKGEKWGIKTMLRRIQSRKKADTLLTGGSVSGHAYKQHWRNVTVGGSNFVDWMPDYWYEGKDPINPISRDASPADAVCWEDRNKSLYSLLPPWLKRIVGKPNLMDLCYKNDYIGYNGLAAKKSAQPTNMNSNCDIRNILCEVLPRTFRLTRLISHSFRGVCDMFYPFFTKHIPAGAPADVVEWKRRVLMIVGCEEDEGYVRVYDGDGRVAQLYLAHVKKLAVSPHIIHTIELHDGGGSYWLLRPDLVDDQSCTTQFALNMLEKYCCSNTEKVTICHEGFLSKRGVVNRAYQKRWFVLDSDCKWRYFKYDTGQCKGEISIANIQHISVIGCELNVTTKERVWSFLSESDEDAEFWRIALLSVYDRVRSQS